ncbi:hypothetical protein H0H87_003593, partial [Tephrocybe sp. NHM501043]
AWEKCIVNLGGECLLARNTKAAYHAYYKADKLFREEIESKIGSDAIPDMAEIMDLEPDSEDEPEEDEEDTDIPLSRIVYEALELRVDDEGPNDFCTADDLVVEGENGFLHSGGREENIWAFRDDGRPMGS